MAWVAFVHSGVDPVVVGLVWPDVLRLPGAAGRAGAGQRPLPLLPRAADRRTWSGRRGSGIASALSPNDRLQRLYHPWSSYVIVPLFALANAGIEINGSLLSRRLHLADHAGHPARLRRWASRSAIVGASALGTRLSRGRMRPPVGWAAVAGGGTIAGIGFTVSLLIATLAFDGRAAGPGEDRRAQRGGLRDAQHLAGGAGDRPAAEGARARALLGTAESVVDLAEPVDPERDHVRGPMDAPVTVVEYGDFECPYCGQAESVVRELLADFGDVRYVWRHLPLTDVHPHAQLAAEAAEAAGLQGAFWEMRDLLFDHQDALQVKDLLRHAEELGLDVERLQEALRGRKGAARVERDVESADLSGVSGTPTFFVNGRRHHGAYDIQSLSARGGRGAGPCGADRRGGPGSGC